LKAQIKLIVGLGNPGSEYRGTRHNAGADFLLALAQQCSTTLQPESKFFGLAGRANYAGHDLRLLIPTTFMNRSGQAVSAMAGFYKIEPEEILVAHDELDIAAGSAKFKRGGGHGGHIGHPGHASRVTGYVLGNPSQADRKRIDACIDEAVAALPLLLNGDEAKAMSQLHSFSAA